MTTGQEVANDERARDANEVNRDRLVRLLLTDAEYEAIKEAADARRVTLSEYIRQRVLGTATVTTVVPVKPPPPPVIKPTKRRR